MTHVIYVAEFVMVEAETVEPGLFLSNAMGAHVSLMGVTTNANGVALRQNEGVCDGLSVVLVDSASHQHLWGVVVKGF